MTESHPIADFAQFRFVRDGQGQMVRLPSQAYGEQLFLVLDCERYRFARVHLFEDEANRPELLEAFKEEMDIVAALNNYYVSKNLTWGQDEGELFYVNEMHDGEPLINYLEREGKISPRMAALWLQPFANLLEADRGVPDSLKRFSNKNFQVVRRSARDIAELKFTEFTAWLRPGNLVAEHSPDWYLAQTLCSLVSGVPLREFHLGSYPDEINYLRDDLRAAVLATLDPDQENTEKAFYEALRSTARDTSYEATVTPLPQSQIRAWMRLEAAQLGEEADIPTLESKAQADVDLRYAQPQEIKGLPGTIQFFLGSESIPDDGWFPQHGSAMRKIGKGLVNQLPIHTIDEQGPLLLVGEEASDGLHLRKIIRDHGPLKFEHTTAMAKKVSSALDGMENTASGFPIWWLPADNVIFKTGFSEPVKLAAELKEHGSAYWERIPVRLRLHQTMQSLIDGIALPDSLLPLANEITKENAAARRSAALLPIIGTALSGKPFNWEVPIRVSDPGVPTPVIAHLESTRQALLKDPTNVKDGFFSQYLELAETSKPLAEKPKTDDSPSGPVISSSSPLVIAGKPKQDKPEDKPEESEKADQPENKSEEADKPTAEEKLETIEEETVNADPPEEEKPLDDSTEEAEESAVTPDDNLKDEKKEEPAEDQAEPSESNSEEDEASEEDEESNDELIGQKVNVAALTAAGTAAAAATAAAPVFKFIAANNEDSKKEEAPDKEKPADESSEQLSAEADETSAEAPEAEVKTEEESPKAEETVNPFAPPATEDAPAAAEPKPEATADLKEEESKDELSKILEESLSSDPIEIDDDFIDNLSDDSGIDGLTPNSLYSDQVANFAGFDGSSTDNVEISGVGSADKHVLPVQPKPEPEPEPEPQKVEEEKKEEPPAADQEKEEEESSPETIPAESEPSEEEPESEVKDEQDSDDQLEVIIPSEDPLEEISQNTEEAISEAGEDQVEAVDATLEDLPSWLRPIEESDDDGPATNAIASSTAKSAIVAPLDDVVDLSKKKSKEISKVVEEGAGDIGEQVESKVSGLTPKIAKNKTDKTEDTVTADTAEEEAAPVIVPGTKPESEKAEKVKEPSVPKKEINSGTAPYKVEDDESDKGGLAWLWIALAAVALAIAAFMLWLNQSQTQGVNGTENKTLELPEAEYSIKSTHVAPFDRWADGYRSAADQETQFPPEISTHITDANHALALSVEAAEGKHFPDSVRFALRHLQLNPDSQRGRDQLWANLQAWTDFTKNTDLPENGSANASLKVLSDFNIRDNKPDEALYLLYRSAINGNAEAMRALGVLFGQGKVMPADANAAKHWLEQAANSEDAEAQFFYGENAIFGF
ncbi:MAG: hypothetical protein AAF226_04070 [Verrucomicrobiota bacterium]